MSTKESRSNQRQTVFQCEHKEKEMLHHIKHKAYQACLQLMNQQVQVQTVDGQVVEGTIVHVDAKHVYISPNPWSGRQYPPYSPYPPPYYPPYPQPSPYPAYNPYASTILPLVLYELLVISLL